ncbi:MAG: putative RND superfamily exporter protein [Planctomycetota bacterium]|jgi:predicted RND superfamily exporter protein
MRSLPILDRDRPRRTLWLLWFAWIAACALATWLASTWPTDNSLTVWTGPSAEDAGLSVLEERFGGDAVVIVRIQGQDLDRASFMEELGARLSALPTVQDVVDPQELVHIGQEELETDGAPLAGALPIARALHLVGENRLDYLLLIEPAPETPARVAFAASLEELSKEARAGGLELHAAGHPLVATSLDSQAARVEQIFVPLLVVLATIAIACLLRSLLLAAATVLPAVLASSGARAALMALEIPSNMILVALGPLAFVLVLAATLQLAFAFTRHSERLSAFDAARAARREKWPAALLATLTTSAGFGVFLTSRLRPVADLGVTVAITLLVMVPLAYLAIPPLLGGLALARARAGAKAGARLRRLAVAARRRRAVVVPIGLGLLCAGGWSLASLPRETNALTFFEEEHPLRRAFGAIEADGGGLSTIEVLIEGAYEMPAGATLGAQLLRLEGVGGVFGPENVSAEIEARGAGVLRHALEGTAQRRARRVDKSGEWHRWTVRFPTTGTDETRDLVERVTERVRVLEASGAKRWHVTGTLPAMLAVQGALVSTLLTSLTLTLVVTLLAFLLVCRGAYELLVVLFVNLVPVTVAFTCARLFGYALDAATVMVAAVVLGLAVDNTFHLLHAAALPSDGLSGGRDRRRLAAFATVGPPAVASAAALALGFACLALSGFAPMARFGLLTACGALGSLFGDLILLPALWLRPKSNT